MMPARIQRRRAAGWAMPDTAVYVGRHVDRYGQCTWYGRWGNPFLVKEVAAVPPVKAPMWGVFHDGQLLVRWDTKRLATTEAVDRFRQAVDRGWGSFPWPAEIRAHLAGKDLACWCPLPLPGEPDMCHASVLLRVAAGGDP